MTALTPKLPLSHERALRRLAKLLGARPHLLAVCVGSNEATRDAVERALAERVAPRGVRRETIREGEADPWPQVVAGDEGAPNVVSVALPAGAGAGLLARLNLAREGIPRAGLSVLLWVEGFEGLDALREHAPDLWATRGAVLFFLSLGGVGPEARRVAEEAVTRPQRTDDALHALDGEIARELLSPGMRMAALVRRAQVLIAKGRYPDAKRDVDEARSLSAQAEPSIESRQAVADGISLSFWLWSRQGDLERILVEGLPLVARAGDPHALGLGAAGLMEYARTLRHRGRAAEAISVLTSFSEMASTAAARDDANYLDVVNCRLERVHALRALGAHRAALELARQFAQDRARLGATPALAHQTAAGEVSRALSTLHLDAAEPHLSMREGIIALTLATRLGRLDAASRACATIISLCIDTGDLEDAFGFSWELLHRNPLRDPRTGGNDWLPRIARLARRHRRDVDLVLQALQRTLPALIQDAVVTSRVEWISVMARVRVALGGEHAKGARTAAVRDLRAMIPEADRGGVDHGFAVREALAALSFDMERWDDAARYLQWLLGHARRGWGRPTQARLHTTLGTVAQRRGHHEEALRHFDEARTAYEADPEALRSRLELKRWRMARAKTMEALGDRAAARDDLTVVREALTREGLRRELFDVLLALASLRPAPGADEHRMEAARAALEMARDADLVGEEARSLVAVAALYAEAGDRASAIPLAREAAWIAEELADDATVRRAKAILDGGSPAPLDQNL